MAKKAGKNKGFTTAVVILFMVLLILLIFSPKVGIPFVNQVISLPNKLYLYVLYPLLYYFGGFVFQLVFFKNAGLCVGSFVRAMLTFLSVAIFVLILFFIFLYLQDATFIGKIVKISLSKTVREMMYFLMNRSVLLFVGGIFLYHSFS